MVALRGIVDIADVQLLAAVTDHTVRYLHMQTETLALAVGSVVQITSSAFENLLWIWNGNQICRVGLSIGVDEVVLEVGPIYAVDVKSDGVGYGNRFSTSNYRIYSPTNLCPVSEISDFPLQMTNHWV